MADDPHKPRFMSYLSLFTFAMLTLVTADNFVQLFFRLNDFEKSFKMADFFKIFHRKPFYISYHCEKPKNPQKLPAWLDFTRNLV